MLYRWLKRPKPLGITLLVLSLLFIVGCGAAATPVPEALATKVPDAIPTRGIQATPIPAPQQTQKQAPESAPPTAVAKPTAVPERVASAQDTFIFVTDEEPTTVGAGHPNCSGNMRNTICDDIATDPLTWIDNETFEIVPLQPIEGWEQIDTNRWRFKLRDNVVFHNGAEWNATQAKFWIDYLGDEETRGHAHGNDFTFHGVFSGEVVDPLTLDIVCKIACPILPRTTIFTKFMDVEWFKEHEESEDDLLEMTVGLGPYKIIEWDRDQRVTLEANEDYNPNPAAADAQAPVILNLIQLWRNEDLVRAAMLQTGEAHWAPISLDDVEKVPKHKVSTNNESINYPIDTIYHPELRKFEVRMALNLAIDCESLVEQLYKNLFTCYGNIAQKGTVGITDRNSSYLGYDPEEARKLLECTSTLKPPVSYVEPCVPYDSANKIILTVGAGRWALGASPKPWSTPRLP